jgi:hypothetical protein
MIMLRLIIKLDPAMLETGVGRWSLTRVVHQHLTYKLFGFNRHILELRDVQIINAKSDLLHNLELILPLKWRDTRKHCVENNSH